MDGQVGEQMDGWVNGRIDGCVSEQTVLQTGCLTDEYLLIEEDKWIDRQNYRNK